MPICTGCEVINCKGKRY